MRCSPRASAEGVALVSETPLPEATRAALARVGRSHWDGFAAVIAASIGLIALLVSGYTAYLQRQQVRAQVWPYLEPGLSSSMRKVSLFNKGAGPAIIRSVQIRVDGKPQKDWNAVFAALGIHYEHHIPYSTVNGVVISANDDVTQLLFPTPEDFNLYAHQVRRVQTRLCYCSSLGDCWTYDSAAPTPAQTHQPVAECRASGADEFRDYEDAVPAPPGGNQENPS
jgi:hypothetical protein